MSVEGVYNFLLQCRNNRTQAPHYMRTHLYNIHQRYIRYISYLTENWLTYVYEKCEKNYSGIFYHKIACHGAVKVCLLKAKRKAGRTKTSWLTDLLAGSLTKPFNLFTYLVPNYLRTRSWMVSKEEFGISRKFLEIITQPI